MTLEEIKEAVRSATTPEEVAAIYFAAAIKDSVTFNKKLNKKYPGEPMTYPTDLEIDALQRAMLELLPEGIEAYSNHPIPMARRAGLPLTPKFSTANVMNQLLRYAGVAPDSTLKRHMPSEILRLLPTQVFLGQILIWSKEN